MSKDFSLVHSLTQTHSLHYDATKAMRDEYDRSLDIAPFDILVKTSLLATVPFDTRKSTIVPNGAIPQAWGSLTAWMEKFRSRA